MERQESSGGSLSLRVRQAMREEYECQKIASKDPIAWFPHVITIGVLLATLAFHGGKAELGREQIEDSFAQLESEVKESTHDLRNQLAEMQGYVAGMNSRVEVLATDLNNSKDHTQREFERMWAEFNSLSEADEKNYRLIERNISNYRALRGRFDAFVFRPNEPLPQENGGP